jgi:hypothetical protein
VAIDQAQQVVLRNVVFDAEVVEQRLCAGVLSHHEQQASENGDQAQRQELLSAYNVPLPRSQAPTLGLFQQLHLFRTVIGSE